ncbi:MAG TPA: HD domain-containing protein [Planctomycetia bacterium]|nr:HD domain-containing protein [Planctomycetia bacterium]
MKTIRDAVHGDIAFDEEEMALVDSPPIQRLRGVKQLGASHLVFPSAVHTRFEHSLGACWLARRILESLALAGHEVAPDDRRTVLFTALLHDVTHVPFGHTFEDERRLFDRHDEDPARLEHFLGHSAIDAVLSRTGQSERVRAALLKRSGISPFVREIVSGCIGADLLDYLHRDALFCGLSLRYDERLFMLFRLAGDHLVVKLHKNGAVRRDALSELLHLLQMRYSLTERVYYHHAKIVAGAMVSRALELCLDAGVFAREELYSLRDDGLLLQFERLGPRVEGLADLAGDLADRRLYKRVFELAPAGLGRHGLSPEERHSLAARFHVDRASRRAAEAKLAAFLGAPESHVIVYCPSPKMSLKEADVPVEIAAGRVQTLDSLGHPDVSGLQEKHAGIWRFVVCVRREHLARRAALAEKCAEIIGFAPPA